MNKDEKEAREQEIGEFPNGNHGPTAPPPHLGAIILLMATILERLQLLHPQALDLTSFDVFPLPSPAITSSAQRQQSPEVFNSSRSHPFQALLLLYDVTNKTSFDNTRAWLGEIHEFAQDDVVIMLIGNKADSGAARQVKYEDGERLAKEYRVAFMETSAKTGQNVELAFVSVARFTFSLNLLKMSPEKSPYGLERAM
ncbi:RAB37 [Cordylochernes scorpioides]|uniref:RAB37 n=1 Tax=Cordylochernes scorpioides TaxID=51811 RepID=A0ABY6JWY7_9ARAC|nr:RAB37 [Cordylochernes scorpioides]